MFLFRSAPDSCIQCLPSLVAWFLHVCHLNQHRCCFTPNSMLLKSSFESQICLVQSSVWRLKQVNVPFLWVKPLFFSPFFAEKTPRFFAAFRCHIARWCTCCSVSPKLMDPLYEKKYTMGMGMLYYTMVYLGISIYILPIPRYTKKHIYILLYMVYSPYASPLKKPTFCYYLVASNLYLKHAAFIETRNIVVKGTCFTICLEDMIFP